MLAKAKSDVAEREVANTTKESDLLTIPTIHLRPKYLRLRLTATTRTKCPDVLLLQPGLLLLPKLLQTILLTKDLMVQIQVLIRVLQAHRN